MTTTIWKYTAPDNELAVETLDLPALATVVHVGTDPGGTPALWVLLDTDAPTTQRTFRIAGTGHELGPHETYVGTYHEGPYVWHVMEVTA